MINARALGTHRRMAFILALVLTALTTWVFAAWQPKTLVPAALFTGVFVSWMIWWFFYIAIYLGIGSGVALSAEAKVKKAVGTAIIASGTALSIWIVSNIAPDHVNLAVFPLHIGFVFLLVAQTLDTA